MRVIDILQRRLRSLFRPGAADRELDEERRWVLLTDAVGKALRFA